MDFYQYKTYAEYFKQDWKTYYKTMLSNLFSEIKTISQANVRESCICGYNQNFSELQWYEWNKPYYKIYPDFVPMFAKTKLTVPAEYLKLPFPTISIRLPVGNLFPFLQIDSNPDLFVRTITLSQANQMNELYDATQTQRISMWIDIGETYDLDRGPHPVLTFQNIVFDNGEKEIVQVALERNAKNRDFSWGATVSHDLIETCFKIAVSVSLLATGGDKLVELEVLNKDIEKYKIASQEKRLLIENKAKKYGKFGWSIGKTESTFIRSKTQEPQFENNEEERKHWQLKYSHIRGGHFHIVKFGKNRQNSKQLWFRPTLVKPDLPPMPSRGYKT